jgi:soluble lytic murein transglycosylase-like protein
MIHNAKIQGVFMQTVIAVILGLSLSSAGMAASCWENAGQEYGIDPLLLKAIAWKESRARSDALGPVLPDGNRALGLIQINSIHLPILEIAGIHRDDLFDACVSQRVGAWLHADCIHRIGPTWKAVGCYYTGPASKNITAQVEYARDVQRYYDGYLRQEHEQQIIAATKPISFAWK